jgi:hypothetical protein
MWGFSFRKVGYSRHEAPSEMFQTESVCLDVRLLENWNPMGRDAPANVAQWDSALHHQPTVRWVTGFLEFIRVIPTNHHSTSAAYPCIASPWDVLYPWPETGLDRVPVAQTTQCPSVWAVGNSEQDRKDRPWLNISESAWKDRAKSHKNRPEKKNKAPGRSFESVVSEPWSRSAHPSTTGSRHSGSSGTIQRLWGCTITGLGWA